MPGMVPQLMRRGAEATFRMHNENEKLQLPTWGLVLLGITAAVYVFASGMVR
jgi:hypothetical protein